VGRGIGILISGIVIYAVLVITLIFSFFLQGLSFLASGSPTIGIESISTIFVLVVLHILFFGYGKYLTLEKEQRNLMK